MYKQRYKARNGQVKDRWVESFREAGRRRYVTAPTRGALRAKLERRKQEAARKAESTGALEMVSVFLPKWFDSMRYILRPQSLLAYRQHYRLYIEPALGKKRVGELVGKDVDDMLNAMADRGLAPSTRNQSRAILRKALQTLVKARVLQWNAAAESNAPKRDHLEMKTWSPAEATRFLAQAQGHSLEALWTLAILRGLRIGELLGLQWKRVDLEKGTLKVDVALHKIKGAGLHLMAPKTRKAYRTISLPPRCILALERHLAAQRLIRVACGPRWEDRDLVFPNKWGCPLWSNAVREQFYRLTKDAGLGHIRFHDLRHTCATLLLEQGESARLVQELLGHSSIVVTLGIYSHIRAETERASAKKLEDKILGTESGSAVTAAVSTLEAPIK